MNNPSVSFVCTECGHRGQCNTPNDLGHCPNCSSKRRTLIIEFEDTIGVYDELDMIGVNRNSDIVSERIHKTDLNTEARLETDAGTPYRMSVDRNERVDGFREEGEAANALVKSYNALHGTTYTVKNKAEEDSDYADRVFISSKDIPEIINIQIRHLDTEIVSGLGRNKSYRGDRTPDDLLKSIRSAIRDKAAIDPALKSQTILQLLLPVPIGAGLRKAVESEEFECMGFRQVWVSPFHEESFPLKSS